MLISTISQRAIDLIVAAEVTDQHTYDTLYARPTWPGGASGVTIAIGYDLGYVTHSEFTMDWDMRLPSDMSALLEHAISLRGQEAHHIALDMRPHVLVPWDAAMAVFVQRDLVKWTVRVRQSLANTNLLSPDSLGALVSLTYNRGASFAMPGDRYNEMRLIKSAMAAKQFAMIPDYIRSMSRLWPNMRGLRIRRDAEAVLFADGLRETPSAPAA